MDLKAMRMLLPGQLVPCNPWNHAYNAFLPVALLVNPFVWLAVPGRKKTDARLNCNFINLLNAIYLSIYLTNVWVPVAKYGRGSVSGSPSASKK
jgi:hypothetical protein